MPIALNQLHCKTPETVEKIDLQADPIFGVI